MHRFSVAQKSRHGVEKTDSFASLNRPQRHKPQNPRHRGLPKTPIRRQEKRNQLPGRYVELLKQHAAAGPTPPQDSDNTKALSRSVQAKWDRFCGDELRQDPEKVIENLEANHVKTWFDWLADNFEGSIKSDRSLATYWRVLHGLYYRKTFKKLDNTTTKDCNNYRRVVSERMGLRKKPLPKPTAKMADLRYFLVFHLVWDDSVFPDEAQRFYLLVGLNLSCDTASRAVSLFDTRKKTDDCEPLGIEEDSEKSETLIEDNSSEDDASILDSYDAVAAHDLHGGHEEAPTSAYGVADLDSTYFRAGSEDIQFSGINPMRDAFCDMDLDNESDNGSDISSVTDDGYLGGNDQTRTILWRHISFRIVRNPKQGMPHILIAIITIVNTKGQDRKERVKRFAIGHEYNPLFDLLGQLIAMAFHDEIFLAEFSDVEQIYWVGIPDHRRGLELKIKSDKLDIPLFRQPERSDCGHRTSKEVPLHARTMGKYQKRMGKKAGSKENITQKVFRRGAINAINHKGPASVRDQIADHDSDAVKHYLNDIVECDVPAAFLERASNEEVQKEVQLVTFLADITAPTGLTEEDKIFISQNPIICTLRSESKSLTEQIHAQGYCSWKDAVGSELYDRKVEVERQLSRELTRLRERLEAKNRQRHFRDADTKIINDWLNGVTSQHSKPTLPVYSVPERGEFVDLVYKLPANLNKLEVHHLRLTWIRICIRWLDKQERPRRGMLAAPSMRPPPVPELPATESIADKYQRKQCPFCVANLALPRGDRETPFSRVHQMWNHVETIHHKELAAFDTGKRPCSICKARGVEYIPPSVSGFQRHTQEAHKIKLRQHTRDSLQFDHYLP